MGASVADAITAFLKKEPCSEDMRQFLIRVQGDDCKRIDKIWRDYAESTGETDTAELREKFVTCLSLIWQYSEGANLMAATKRAIRGIHKVSDMVDKWIAKRIADKNLPLEIKAKVASFSDKWFKRLVEGSPDSCEPPLKELEAKIDSPLALVRSEHSEKGRQRTVFMRKASDFFYGGTGQWHDDWVADLTDLGFPEFGETTIEMVRSARRGMRPTTQQPHSVRKN